MTRIRRTGWQDEESTWKMKQWGKREEKTLRCKKKKTTKEKRDDPAFVFFLMHENVWQEENVEKQTCLWHVVAKMKEKAIRQWIIIIKS